MHKTLAEIAELVDGTVVGDGNLILKGLSGIKEAREGDLTFLANSKYFPLLETTGASAVIIPRGMNAGRIAAIETENPSLAFARIATLISHDKASRPEGIHPTAVIAGDAVLGKSVNVGPYTVIESGAVIGDHTTIFSHCFIGHQARVGREGLIYPNITIRERVVIGDRVIIHSGTVIGSDGFGFVNVKGVNVKIPQIGTVEIQDDVEIGANVTIDRARFDKTVIGRGTKIDNLVQIAHNVRIGENCIIVSQVGISGSTILENNVTLAGQVGVVGHITIGANTVVASKSGVPNSIPPNSIYWGIPANPIMEAKRINASVQRLPHYVKVIHELKKKVEALESRLKNMEAS